MYPLYIQPKPPEFNPKHVFSAFIIVLVALALFFAMIVFTGCNPAKIAARKDAQAVDRVKGSRNLINQIAPIVNDLFPCNRDSVIITKSDTVIHYDTTQNFSHYEGSIFKTDTLQNFFHYEGSIFKTDTLRLKIIITRTIHDTTKIVTDSKQRAAIDGQTISTLNTELSASTQAVIDAEGATRKADKWLWWFIGACVACVASNGIWVYSKFKV